MMKERILQLVSDSFGSQLYSKAMDCLKAFRSESIKVRVNCYKFHVVASCVGFTQQAIEPKVFNEFLQSFKETIKEKGRSNFWDLVIKGLSYCLDVLS
jgi:ATP-dependent DNA helicase 2 subunit 2